MQLSKRGMCVTGSYFVACTGIAFLLLISPIQVVSLAFKAVYVLVCLAGTFATVRPPCAGTGSSRHTLQHCTCSAMQVVCYRLREAARLRVSLRHAVPVNRTQVFALRTMVE
jgi:hypothetical protein